MDRSFRVTSKKTKYKSSRLKVVEYSILRDGRKGTYGVVERPHSVAVLVVSEAKQLLFLKQYRFPTEAYSWELPMGAIKKGEQPSEAAARELLEETGLRVQLKRIGGFHPVPGLTPQKVDVFMGRVSNKVTDSVSQLSEAVDDIVERRFINRDQILDLIRNGEITDGFTLSTLALYELLEAAR
jgi:8-oxo-dGTP pyrophosphatase MutT (NUDIX family)